MEAAPKVIPITGGARRVGRADALPMARAGYDIAFTYHRSAVDAATLSREIQELGRQCIAIAADFSSPDDAVAGVLSDFQAQFDRLDVLVNNASVYRPGNLQSAPRE